MNRTHEKHNSTRCHGDSCASKSIYCARQRTSVQSLNPHENLDAVVGICNLRTSILRWEVKTGKFCRCLLVNYPGVYSTVTESDSNKSKEENWLPNVLYPPSAHNDTCKPGLRDITHVHKYTHNTCTRTYTHTHTSPLLCSYHKQQKINRKFKKTGPLRWLIRQR